MEDFDKLWDYSQLAETENKFKEVLAAKSYENNPSYYLQLQTQTARTYSLRGMFKEAHELLNEVEQQLSKENDVASIRYHLERGRTYNSSGNKTDAKKHFDQTKTVAEILGEDAYIIDAIHMLAIISPHEAVRLNESAITLAEGSQRG